MGIHVQFHLNWSLKKLLDFAKPTKMLKSLFTYFLESHNYQECSALGRIVTYIDKERNGGRNYTRLMDIPSKLNVSTGT